MPLNFILHDSYIPKHIQTQTYTPTRALILGSKINDFEVCFQVCWGSVWGWFWRPLEGPEKCTPLQRNCCFWEPVLASEREARFKLVNLDFIFERVLQLLETSGSI